MGFLTIRAPADGWIIRRDGEVGDFVPLNQPVFYLAKAGSPPRITADVDEEDVPLVTIGQKVLIRADAFPDQVFDGSVAEITPKGDPVARSFRVRIALPENTPLRIGMTAETNIVTRENKDALLIQTSALRSWSEALGQANSAGGIVWLVRDGRARRQPVRIGIRGRERTEITSGVTESDHVVVDALQNLEPDERVILKQAAPPALASDTPQTGATQ
jgi:RND family efflux transporter MFP subunit